MVACSPIQQKVAENLSSAEENFSLDVSSMPAHSSPSEVPVELLIGNQSLQAIEVIWVDYEGQESFSKILSAGFTRAILRGQNSKTSPLTKPILMLFSSIMT